MNSKQSIDDLAIFQGRPAFADTLHVGRPNIGDRQRLEARIGEIFDRAWLTNEGPCVKEFEREVANLLGVRHCIAVCNATIALEILIRAADLSGEVIIPSMTFIATAHALQWQEITPIFCDIDPKTHNIDPLRVEQLITPRTTGIIGVHLWGRPCDVESLSEIAGRRNLKLLFDAAHAFGCSYNGQMIGHNGLAEVFSFHATKFFNTMEGGAVVTNDDDLAAKIELMKNFGFQGFDNVIYIGTNGKMNEVSAAVGLTSLESLDEFIRINRRNYRLYQQHLADLAGISVATYDESDKNNYQFIVLTVDDRETRISRDEIMNILWAENVRARRYFFPGCHRMEPYRSYYPHAGFLLPETEKLSERVLCLPNGITIEPDDIGQICEVIQIAVENGAEVSQRLHAETHSW